MPEIKEVKPSYDGSPSIASYYFYSEYDPTTHFEYKVPFDKDGIKIDAKQYIENKLNAYRKVIEYHFNFEQVLPKQEKEFIYFYRPNYINQRPQDYNYKFENITQQDFETNLETEFETPIILEIPTKNEYITKVAQSCVLEKEYSQMTYEELREIYEDWNNFLEHNTQFIDATNWNKHCYECATYCKIYRPRKIDENGRLIPIYDDKGQIIPDKYEYVSPYEFRRYLRLINSIFGFKLPVEEGWYKYNKQTKKWEAIVFLSQVGED